MRFSTLEKNKQQNGMALILAIAFLAVLSILGAVVMDVSTRDLRATTPDLPKQKAFYVADRAVEYSMNRDIIYYLNPLTNSASLDLKGNAMGVDHEAIIIVGESNVSLDSGTVEDLGESELSPYMASLHGSDFGANLYHVQVKSTAYKDTAFEESTHVDAAIVRLYKKDDDQIFRTSGGG